MYTKLTLFDRQTMKLHSKCNQTARASQSET